MSGMRLVLDTDLRSVLWGPCSGFGEDKSKDTFICHVQFKADINSEMLTCHAYLG